MINFPLNLNPVLHMGIEIVRGLQGRSIEECYQKNIFLLGPSGVGKSRHAKTLAENSSRYTHVEVDTLIGKHPDMKHLLIGVPGEDEAEKMGILFGKPWEGTDGYRKLQEQYLEIERAAMRQLISQVREGGPYVADLTGSAIYCPEELKELVPQGIAIYLEVPPRRMEQMKTRYLKDPKPVIWGDLLNQWEKLDPDVNPIDRLPTLYQRLLKTRAVLYEQFADVTLRWHAHRKIRKKRNARSFFRAVIRAITEKNGVTKEGINARFPHVPSMKHEF